MGYWDSLSASRQWLKRHQNADGGWGVAAKAASSLVNTSEAIAVLRAHGAHEDAANNGLQFIATNFHAHLASFGARTRYASFPLLLTADLLARHHQASFEEIRDWLKDASNQSGGWGVEERDGASDVFSTSVAIRALRRSGTDDAWLRPHCQWLLSQEQSGKWKLDGADSPVSTGYAISALAECGPLDHDLAKNALAFLVQTKHWNVVPTTVSGTLWHHSTYAAVVPALIALGELPYATAVAEAIRYINRHTAPLGQGEWIEVEATDSRTIRAQYWAVSTLSHVQQAFDPGIHSPRLDAERAATTLTEPEFVKFEVQSTRAVIMPAQLFRMAIYSGLALAFASLIDFPGLLQVPASAVRLGFSASLAAGAVFLALKRPKLFPRWLMVWFGLAVVAAAIADAVFGLSLVDIFGYVGSLGRSQ